MEDHAGIICESFHTIAVMEYPAWNFLLVEAVLQNPPSYTRPIKVEHVTSLPKIMFSHDNGVLGCFNLFQS